MRPATRLFNLLLLLMLTAMLAGCGEDDSAAPTINDENFDTPATMAKRIGRTNEFALDLFHHMADSDDNLIVSPHSIVTCFGMAYAGARGASEREIANTLHFNYPQQGFHSVLKELNDLLMSRQGVTLVINNGAWGADYMTYLPEYLDTLSTAYGADMEMLDFANDPEGARQTINDWVSLHTLGRINDLFPPNSFDAVTYLVMANTTYFIADWLHQFKPEYTWKEPFKLLDGSTVDVEVMNGEENMPFFDGDGYTALEMLYRGEKISMVVIVPDEGKYKNFEAGFTTAVFDSILANLSVQYVTFEVPKFGYFSNFDLIPTLQAMGMTGVFAAGADFSGMDGTPDGIPWIDQVVHKGYIEINEYGTLAFFGTGMEMTIGVHDHLDAKRPFIYVVRDIDTGTILFMGRVLDPLRRQES